MNASDEQQLTEYWTRETSNLNDKIDEAFKEAQNLAYEIGVTRGQSIEQKNNHKEQVVCPHCSQSFFIR